MYLHSMSGYTMSFYKCTITGLENISAGYVAEDPCGEKENDCHKTTSHYEMTDCCETQHTIVSVEDDFDISLFKIPFYMVVNHTHPQLSPLKKQLPFSLFYNTFCPISPPELCKICVFRL